MRGCQHATQLPATLAPLVRRNAVEINPVTFDTKRLITAVHKTLAEEQARRQAEEQARRQTDERVAGSRPRTRTGGRPGRLPHALVWSWVLLVGLVAAAAIGYVLWGGAAEDLPNRAQVSGTLLAAVVIVPPVVVWGVRRRHRPVAGDINAGGG